MAFRLDKKPKAQSPDMHGVRSGAPRCSVHCPPQRGGSAFPKQPSRGPWPLLHGWWRVDGGTVACAAPLSCDLS